MASHADVDCRYGGCEVSLKDPAELRSHVFDEHFGGHQLNWLPNPLDQYLPYDTDLPDYMRNVAETPGLEPYCELPSSYSPACETAGTELGQDMASATSIPPNHPLYTAQVASAWPNSVPFMESSANQGNELQPSTQSSTSPSSLDAPIGDHMCKWIISWEPLQLCNQDFDTPEELQDHLKIEHCTPSDTSRRAVKPQPICYWLGCPRENHDPFTDVHKLVRHALTHSKYCQYSCQYCFKKVSTTGQLKIHERTHTGEKPVNCDFCDKTTSNESQMAIHRRTHTGEKPYRCEQCGFHCADSTNLIKHKKKHGPNEWKCEICERTFNRKHTLQRHMKVHNKKGPMVAQSPGALVMEH
ncbi:MAG: hypothetical protein LQ352_004900 [Teloschistes flavicans]|nr:MAG: hypothetical protein LQ352_004900 [Teloschistes flavicans]